MEMDTNTGPQPRYQKHDKESLEIGFGKFSKLVALVENQISEALLSRYWKPDSYVPEKEINLALSTFKIELKPILKDWKVDASQLNDSVERLSNASEGIVSRAALLDMLVSVETSILVDAKNAEINNQLTKPAANQILQEIILDTIEAGRYGKEFPKEGRYQLIANVLAQNGEQIPDLSQSVRTELALNISKIVNLPMKNIEMMIDKAELKYNSPERIEQARLNQSNQQNAIEPNKSARDLVPA